jgi:hypothetical protein
VYEAGPRRECQCAANADPSDAERRDLSDTQANVPHYEEVERHRCNRLDERLDFCGMLRTRGEKHVRPRCGVRLQTSY